jgi:hypothetical protein
MFIVVATQQTQGKSFGLRRCFLAVAGLKKINAICQRIDCQTDTGKNKEIAVFVGKIQIITTKQ